MTSVENPEVLEFNYGEETYHITRPEGGPIFKSEAAVGEGNADADDQPEQEREIITGAPEKEGEQVQGPVQVQGPEEEEEEEEDAAAAAAEAEKAAKDIQQEAKDFNEYIALYRKKQNNELNADDENRMNVIKKENPGFTDQSVEDELKKQENLNGGKKRKTSKRKTKKGKKVGKKKTMKRRKGSRKGKGRKHK